MIKLVAVISIVVVLIGSAYDSQETQTEPKEMREPPQEAISICEGRSEGDSCSINSPRGDTLSGRCQNTPDGKYFACKPENMGSGRGPKR